MSKLRSSVGNIGKQRLTFGTVQNVLNNRCSVRISGGGAMLTGLPFIGPTPIVGQQVRIDYISGAPIVYTSEPPAQEVEEERLLVKPPPKLPEMPYIPNLQVANADDSVKIDGVTKLKFTGATVGDLSDGVAGVTIEASGGGLTIGKYGTGDTAVSGDSGYSLNGNWFPYGDTVTPDIVISGGELIVQATGIYLITINITISHYPTLGGWGIGIAGIYSNGFFGGFSAQGMIYIPSTLYWGTMSGSIMCGAQDGQIIRAGAIASMSAVFNSVIEITKISSQASIYV